MGNSAFKKCDVNGTLWSMNYTYKSCNADTAEILNSLSNQDASEQATTVLFLSSEKNISSEVLTSTITSLNTGLSSATEASPAEVTNIMAAVGNFQDRLTEDNKAEFVAKLDSIVTDFALKVPVAKGESKVIKSAKSSTTVIAPNFSSSRRKRNILNNRIVTYTLESSSNDDVVVTIPEEAFQGCLDARLV